MDDDTAAPVTQDSDDDDDSTVPTIPTVHRASVPFTFGSIGFKK